MKATPTLVPRLLGAWSSFSRRRGLACAAVFLLTLTLRFALQPWLGVPNPVIHDEFSYLLAGDTYAHGRLTNPPHPFWQHFETFQEIQQPSYSSKYPPLQGMVLAVGEVLFHQPWIGAALSSALMCAAVCWMLQGWVSAEWALLGALLFSVRIGVLSYWMNSFEGGAVPAIGGALAFGAVARIAQQREYRHSVTWALGISVMILSRPYDAMVVAISSGLAFLWLLRRSEVSLGPALLRTALPAAAVLALALAAVDYDDIRVTGHAMTLPYQMNSRQYEVASMFVFLPLAPEPVYHHAVMRDFYTGWDVKLWKGSHAEPVVQWLARIYIVVSFFFGAWPLMIPLLLWPTANAMSRVSLALMGAAILSITPLIGVLPHYAAGFAGVFYVRFLDGLAGLSSLRKPWGKAAAVAAVALFVLSGRDSFSQVLASRSAHFGEARAEMQRRLEALPGKQLVLVRYAAGHNPQEEWVFNAADIDGSKVVWAREMDPGHDRPFLEYFHDRRVWLVQPDRTPPSLEPYPAVDVEKEARR